MAVKALTPTPRALPIPVACWCPYMYMAIARAESTGLLGAPLTDWIGI